MAYDPQRHHRRTIRLKGYDYAASGAYYVTICTQVRGAILGTIHDGTVNLNEGGMMVRDYWLALPTRYATVTLDAWVIMPDHLHGLIILNDVVGTVGDGRPGDGRPGDGRPGDGRPGDGRPGDGRPRGSPLPVPLGDIVGWFKTVTTNAYIRGVRDCQWPPFHGRFWQRNYYERIVRTDQDMEHIRTYIAQNPIVYENPS